MNKILKYIYKFNFKKPTFCIILGSGLNSFTNQIKNKTIIRYKDIPNFLETSVKGHQGQLIFGEIGKAYVLCASGRFHYYEGYTFNQVSIIVKLFNHFNPRLSIITNSAGCLNTNWKFGDFMIANKFLDYSFIQSIKTKYHQVAFKKIIPDIINIAATSDINLHKGTYTFTTGPSYETSEEVKDIIRLNGHAVGMSTFPEFLKCVELNMKTIFISCLTNYGAGLDNKKIVRHRDVLINANKSKQNFNQLICNIIGSIELQKKLKIL